VTVPWDPSHVFYVWFDALLNYYTALSYARPGEDLTDRYWPAQFHVIGKDILKFHTIFWPAILMAADIPVPEHVFVHGFLMGEDGRRMSKLLGNGIDPFEVMETFGTDALRFYLTREVTFGQDGNVGPTGLRTRYDTELANEYGNLASRTVAMVRRYRDGNVPQVAVDPMIAQEFDGLAEQVGDLFDRAETTQALDVIWRRVRRLNRYVEERQPWQLAKDESRGAELDETLTTLFEGLRVATVLLHPYMPDSTQKLLDSLGAPDNSYASAHLSAGAVGALSGGVDLPQLEPLFPKLDRELA
jgi:methionyl-tRNA synthetase